MDRVLIIDHKVATPDHDSGSLRMVNLIRVLDQLGWAITYLPQTWGDRRLREELTQLAEALQIDLAGERSVKRHLRQACRSYRAAVLCRPAPTERFLPSLRRYCPDTWCIFDTVDLHHLREHRQSEIEGDRRLRASALELRQREHQLVRETDATVVVSPVERDILLREVPDARISVVPNIHSIAPPGPPFEERSGLVFVAGFEHAPNIDAAVWLVDSIMPAVWRQLPEVALHLVGSHPPTEIQELASPRVHVTGWVPEIEPYLTRSRLSVAPLRFGAGVKGKITQSMAVGLPAVATSLAAEGMPIEHERDILIADRAVDLADTIVHAYRDRELWARLSAAGRENAGRNFSFGAARRSVGALMGQIPACDREDE